VHLNGAGVLRASPIEDARAIHARRARQLEYFTIGWNILEGIIAIAAGAVAGSISLVGFGLDSVLEVVSGLALLWRMSRDAPHQRERSERIALRIVGWCFLGLATYITVDALHDLWARAAPTRSIPGILLAAASLVVMPLLARAKRRVGRSLSSGAMRADATQTQLCAYLSAILLGGLGLNLVWGFWWADPLAALIMAPVIVREGVEGLRGDPCRC
jgi:divalent metal cation (Fe/Co/Zn/Cd) transporter